MTGAIRLLGRDFDNRLGLAAGLDRDGARLAEAPSWGFGFVELGTVTPAPVPGHNAGAAALAARLRTRALASLKVGVNLGPQPGCPPGEAWRDYVSGMHRVDRHADYLVVNLTGEVSSPLLAPGNRAVLARLLVRLHDARRPPACAVLLKLPLVAALQDDAQIVREAAALGFEGVIAVRDDDRVDGVDRLARMLPQPMVLVVTGGIVDAETASACLEAGADLIQIHRAFGAAGPELVRAIVRCIAPACRKRAQG